jgi:hypothetical protein
LLISVREPPAWCAPPWISSAHVLSAGGGIAMIDIIRVGFHRSARSQTQRRHPR